jgi:abortive infection bacteriophage resistance protein
VRLKRGIGRFEDVLNSIELGGPVNEKIKKLIIELYEIRNIVAHKNAVVDERFVNNCPWMETTVGEPINLSREQFSYYFLAVSWYVNEVSRRHLLRYPPEDPSKFSSQESINKLLQSMLDRLKNYAG